VRLRARAVVAVGVIAVAGMGLPRELGLDVLTSRAALGR
jgi:hypothetical protein